MSVVEIQKAQGYAGGSFPNEGSLFFRRKGQASGAGPGILCLHGHGGDCLQYSPYYTKASVGYFANLLAQEGFRVLAIDDMGGTDWGAQASTDRINDAYAWLTGALGATAGKIGVMGWSMGGCAALNWIDQNSAKFAAAWLWAPCSDLSWAHAQSAWTAEIEAAYGGAANYAANAVGNNPVATPQNYRGLGPITLTHAVDDSVVPYSQSQAFVSAVNDSAVALKTIQTGGHTNLFAGVSDLDLVSFFRQNLGVPA